MKISYSNYPVLKNIKLNNLNVMYIYESDKLAFDLMKDDFVETWHNNNRAFNKEINYITKPFVDAVAISQNKLLSIYKEILLCNDYELIINGTYIINGWVYCINYDIKKGEDFNDITLFKFTSSGIPVLYYSNSKKKDRHIIWVANGYMPEILKSVGETFNDKIFSFMNMNLVNIVLFYMFKNFAQVETKITKPHSKIHDLNCKYVNDTDFTICHLDSKWFTTLIKSEGFKVRGHFRLQPKIKDGKWTKELIWIEDFEKHGYTSKARKLSFDKDSEP